MAFLSNLQGGLAGVLADPSMMSLIAGGGAPKSGGGGGHRRGFLGGLRRAFDPSSVAMMQATLSGDYGTAAQIAMQQQQLRARQAAAEQAAQQAAEHEASRAQALASLGYNKNQIGALNADDASQLVRERFLTRQFGPQGGSAHDPVTNQTYRAPWQQQVGRSIIEGGENGGPPQTIYQGVEPIAVQPGGAVYDGARLGQSAAPPSAGPQPGQVVNGYRFRGGNPNDRNSWEPVQGGAGSGAQRPFRASSGDLTILRNNNPGALRIPGSSRFQRFASPAEGVRAQEHQLGRYYGRGLTTIANIVETYAPRRSRGGDNTDEQVNNYIAHVARRTGRDPNQPLSPADIPLIAQAMREFETGRR